MRLTMKLSEFLEKRKMSKADAADMFGVSPMSIYRYLSGEIPNSRVMARIVQETGGLVNISDLIPGKSSSVESKASEG